MKQFNIDSQSYYDTKEVAEILSVTKRTVWCYIRKNKLPAVKVGGRTWVAGKDLIEFLKPKGKED